MVEVPVVVEVLVVPADLAGVGVQGQRGVVVQVRVLDAAPQELRGRRGDGRADEDEVQVKVDAGGRPRPHVHAVLVGHVAPRLLAGLAGGGHQPPAPQLLAGLGVVGHDDARLGPRPRAAAPPRERLAGADDGARRVLGGVDGVVEDLGLPDELAGAGVDGVAVVVVARVDDAGAVDGDVAVHADEPADVVVDVVGQIAAVLPALDGYDVTVTFT